MKKFYHETEMDVIRFNDVITTSSGSEIPSGPPTAGGGENGTPIGGNAS